MKKSMKISFLWLFSCLSILITACSEDEAMDEQLFATSITDAQLSAEVDNIPVVLGDIIIAVFESDVDFDSGRVNAPNHQLPDCVTITRIIQQGYRHVTLDFGNLGCSVHGHILKGKLMYSYLRDSDEKSVTINYSTEDFYFDEKFIEGERSILREQSNEANNPQFTHTIDLTVTWPNGTFAERNGIKIREWVSGYRSGYFSDNVFEISGNWTTKFRNGNSHSYEVITPLRREVICRYFVSGSFEVNRTVISGIFDYGEGECDNKATFTSSNGEIRDIILN